MALNILEVCGIVFLGLARPGDHFQLKCMPELTLSCNPLQVWDARRLERDVSFRSRLTYTGQVRGPGF